MESGEKVLWGLLEPLRLGEREEDTQAVLDGDTVTVKVATEDTEALVEPVAAGVTVTDTVGEGVVAAVEVAAAEAEAAGVGDVEAVVLEDGEAVPLGVAVAEAEVVEDCVMLLDTVGVVVGDTVAPIVTVCPALPVAPHNGEGVSLTVPTPLLGERVPLVLGEMDTLGLPEGEGMLEAL